MHFNCTYICTYYAPLLLLQICIPRHCCPTMHLCIVLLYMLIYNFIYIYWTVLYVQIIIVRVYACIRYSSFGSENWLLNRAMISSLESFQGEIAKRILKWPRHHSNTAAVVVVGLQSVESRILERKLGFLHRVQENGSSCVSGRAVEALSDNISNSCLVKECEELEESCGVSFTRKSLGVRRYGEEAHRRS